jgi:hypothetical protein
VIDLNDGAPDHAVAIARWIDGVRPAVLNIAGPRESGAPGITEQAKMLLGKAFARSMHAKPLELNAAAVSGQSPQVFSALLS